MLRCDRRGGGGAGAGGHRETQAAAFHKRAPIEAGWRLAGGTLLLGGVAHIKDVAVLQERGGRWVPPLYGMCCVVPHGLLTTPGEQHLAGWKALTGLPIVSPFARGCT